MLLEELRAEVARLRARAETLAAVQGGGSIGSIGSQQGSGCSDLETRQSVVREQHLAEELAHVRELLRSTYNDQDAIARSVAGLAANVVVGS